MSTNTPSQNSVSGQGSSTVIEHSTNNGVHTIIKKHFNWNTMSRTKKFAIGTYIAGFLTANISFNYNTGRQALINHQNNPDNRYTDWEIVRYACEKQSWETFWNSVWWPSTIFSNITPWMVLKLNPKPTTSVIKGTD